MATFEFEDPFDDSLEEIKDSLFEQVEILWPDPNNRPDIREGSLMWTLLSPIAFEIQRLQGDLNLALQLGFLQFTFGEFLDLKGLEFGLPRKEGGKAEGILRFLGTDGTIVPTGTTASNITFFDDDESYLFDTTDVGIIEGVDNPVNINEEQKISIQGTDRFTITFDGKTTPPLNASDTGTTIAAALIALSPTNNHTLVAGDIVGDSGIANAGGTTLSFVGSTLATNDIPALVVTPYQVNEEQTFTITSVGDTFNVEFDGQTANTPTTLDETDTAQDLVNELNTIGSDGNTSYGNFTVTTTNTGTDPLSGGVTIVFSGGGVQFQNVPLLSINVVAGAPALLLTEDVVGENSSILGTVEEIKKGRYAPPRGSTNEVQDYGVAGVGTFKVTFDGVEATPVLTQASTGTDVVNAINSLSPHVNHGDFSVSTSSPTTQVDSGSGVRILFDGGGVRGKDLPQLTVTSITGTIVANVSPVVNGGITQPPIALNQNEVQEFRFTSPEIEVVPVQDGSESGLRNQIQRLTIGAPASTAGSFTLTFNDGTTSATTGDILTTFSASNIKNFLEALPNVDVGDINVSLVSGGPTVGDPGPTVFDIEFTGNLRYKQWAALVPFAYSNERQSVSTSNSGTFDITFDGWQAAAPATLDQNSTAQDLINELNVIGSEGNTSFGVFSVSLGAPNVGTDLISGGVIVVFNGGGVAGQDVPPIVVNNLTGTIVGAVSELNKPFTSSLTVSPNQQTAISGATNEKQRIQYKNGVFPSGGTIQLTFQETASSPTETVANIPYNVSAGALQTLLEAMTTYANGSDPAGTNFSVSGSGLATTGGLVIEYTGINRLKNFRPVVITEQLSGTPTSGSFRLIFDNTGSNPIQTSGINATASTQAVTTALEGVGTIGAGNVLVTVATGFQTINFSGAIPTSGTFDLTVDDGTTASTTAPLAYNASAATVQTALEGLASVGAGNVLVVSDTGSTLDLGAEYAVYFLNTATKSYKHMVTAQPTPMAPVTTIDIGPTLDVPGAGYFIEFVGARAATNYNILEYDTGTLTLTPQPNTPRIIPVVNGGPGVNEKQILSLSHPSGFFQLGIGSSNPITTGLISPLLDNATSIKGKLEELGDIAVGSLSVFGGPLTTSTVSIGFVGAPLAGTDVPLLEVKNNTIAGGALQGPIEVVKGHGGIGNVTGALQYGYTLVTRLGVEEADDDPDFESGFGETALSVASPVVAVTNASILGAINPIIRTEDLLAVRKVKVFRSLNGGQFKLVATIDEADISFTELGDENPPGPMYFVDNIDINSFGVISEVAPLVNTTGVIDIEAEAQEIGPEQNLAANSIEILEDAVLGVDKVTNPEPFGGGAEEEDDETYRARLLEEAQKDPGAGNIDDYVVWAKEVVGVESVSVIPEWQEIYGPLEGPGTVKVIVAGEGSSILSDSVLEEVRLHISGTTAIPNPDQEDAPATATSPGGDIEDGIYEYVYTFINVGKGETEPSAASRVEVGDGNKTVTLSMATGQGGIGVSNTTGRRIYRRKVDGALVGKPDSDKFVLVAEVLNNTATSFVDNKKFDDLMWASLTTLTDPGTAYERRKAPLVNSTSLFDGEAPIGAHVTVSPITAETIWVGATLYPASNFSIDGSGGRRNLTVELDTAIRTFISNLPSGQDVRIKDIENVIHDFVGVLDHKDVVLYSPVFSSGTTANIPIGPGVSASYSSQGTFALWQNYPYDKTAS